MNTFDQLRIAREAAQEAGVFLAARFASLKQIEAESAHDIKLQLDRETQSLIVRHLLRHFPHDSVLGEEGTVGDIRSGGRVWIIDPLDGTVNYFYGLPIFCVSIALYEDGKPLLGCVYDPMQRECFCALAGQAATLNGSPIRVSERADLSQAVVFIGHGTHDGSGEAGIRRFASISRRVRKIRILGSAALSLCYIAAGRMDAYVENRINLWDFAAARLILESAGGRFLYTPSAPDGISGAVTAWNGLLPICEALEEND